MMRAYYDCPVIGIVVLHDINYFISIDLTDDIITRLLRMQISHSLDLFNFFVSSKTTSLVIISVILLCIVAERK